MFLSQIIPIIRVPIWHNIPTFGHNKSTRLLTNPKSWVYTTFGKDFRKYTLMIMNTCDLWLWQVKSSITSSKQQRKNCDWNCLDVSVTWLPHSGTGISDPQHKASHVHWLVVLAISTRQCHWGSSSQIWRKQRKPLNSLMSLKASLASSHSSVFQSARLFSHMFEYSVIFFSSAFEKKEIMNPAAWSPPEASTSEELSSTKADGTSKDWRARSTEAEIIFRTSSKMLSRVGFRRGGNGFSTPSTLQLVPLYVFHPIFTSKSFPFVGIYMGF